MLEDFYDAHRKPLRYCTTCPKMCRFACPVAHQEARETVTPWGLMSLLHAVTQGVTPLDASTASILSRCTGCLRCRSACKHEIAVPDTVFAGRALARSQGHVVVDASPDGHAQLIHRLDGPPLGFARTSAVGYYPGCASREGTLEDVRKVGQILRASRLDVELIEDGPACCGQPLLAAGDLDGYSTNARALAERFDPFDVVLTDCEHILALPQSKAHGASWEAAGSTELQHWSQVLAEALRLSPLSSKANLADVRVVYHDACGLGRGAGVYDGPRDVLAWVLGRPPEELDDHREWALCCGAQAGYAEAAPGPALALADGLLDDITRRGTVVVTASKVCARHMRAAARNRDDIEVRELIDVIAEALGGE